MPRFLNDRDLCDDPSALWNALEDGGSAVTLVSEGTPRALVIRVDDGDVALAEDVVVRVRAQLALERLRDEAARNGTDRMTMEEIDAEIAASRAERAAGGGA